jgi:hypothetical protein
MGLLASIPGRGTTTSPIVKALMLLPAAKACQHDRSGPRSGSTGDGPGGMLGDQDGGVGRMPGGRGGRLGALLQGGLGGLLGGWPAVAAG